jgi:hypothetical protein
LRIGFRAASATLVIIAPASHHFFGGRGRTITLGISKEL